MRGPPTWFTQPSFGAEVNENEENEKMKTVRTFYHISSRDCVVCTLLVARRIVEEKKGLCISLGQAVEDVNHVVDLGKQVAGCKPSVPVLARPEYDSSFTE